MHDRILNTMNGLSPVLDNVSSIIQYIILDLDIVSSICVTNGVGCTKMVLMILYNNWKQCKSI